MSQNQNKPDTDLSLSNVGPDNSTPLHPGSTPPDKPPADKPDNPAADKPKVAGPILLILACVVIGVGALIVWALGWWGLAVIVGGVLLLLWLSFWWWNLRSKKQSSTTKWSRSKSSSSRAAAPGSKPGKGKGRGMWSRSGAAGKSSGRVRSRIPRWLGGTKGKSGLSRSGGKNGTGRGRNGSGGTGRGKRKGRGGGLIGSRSGGTGRGGSSRRSKGTPSPGRSRRRSSSHPVRGAFIAGWHRGAPMKEKEPLRDPRGDRKSDDRTGDTVDAIRPGKTTRPSDNDMLSGQSKGETKTMSFRSRFEQLSEELVPAAQNDDITSHDLGLEPLLSGYSRAMPNIADAIKIYRERIQDENFSGTEGPVLEVLEVLERSQRANANIADEALRTLRASPTWQALQERVNNPRGAMSDVSAARQNGYV